jgi:hypothetical protein
MNQQTLDLLKIVTNIILIICLLSALGYTILYKQDVKEAIGSSEPNRLMQLFEERTNTKCLCANPEVGYVTYIPNSKFEIP